MSTFFSLAQPSASASRSGTAVWLTFIPAIVTGAVGLAGPLGLTKYLLEPWYNALALRRKLATAL